MPPRVDPRDWDRLFRRGVPQRGGPLRALGVLLIVGATLGLLGGGAIFALRFGVERTRLNNAATATAAVTATAQAIASATEAAARTATAQAALAAVTPTSVPEPTAVIIGRGSVLAGGNLRSEPVVVPETVIGQVCPGDQIDFLEERVVGENARWFRIVLTQLAADCTPERAPLGREGWVSSTLLSAPE
jgi:DNA-binding transcriptional regulator YdaS (Cro superfamily)